MAMFTPFPLAMATVLYGRARGYAMAFAGLVICMLLGHFVFLEYTLAASYLCLSFTAAIIAESVLRGWSPVRSVVTTGVLLLALFSGVFAAYVKTQQASVHAVVTQEVTNVIARLEEAGKAGNISQNLADLGLARPAGEIAQEVITTVPGYLIMGVFFLLWTNMYLVLKGQRLLRQGQGHDETVLLNFKMPFVAVYLVVAALCLVMWGEKVLPLWGEPVGQTMLKVVGVFYFFQGLGVILSVLNHFQVVGFFRTLFIMAVVFFIPWAVALVGLFDTWFDFDQKFKNKVSNFKEPL
jgi:hypothetical protein